MPKSRISKSRIRRGMIKSRTVVSNLPKRSKKSKMKGGMIRSSTVISNLPKKSKRSKSRSNNKSKKSNKK